MHLILFLIAHHAVFLFLDERSLIRFFELGLRLEGAADVEVDGFTNCAHD